MKITKHSQENMPELISGFLVGIDIEDSLHITNCFPFPHGMSSEDTQEFQFKVLEYCKIVNLDAYNVGCYQSTYLGSYVNDGLIRSQYAFQTNTKITNKCVAIIYDQMKTVRSGSLAIKAVRLREQFIKIYKQNNGNLTSLDLNYREVFEEIPIRIRNNGLANAFIMQLETTNVLKPNFDNLDLASNLYLERTSEFLLGGIDEINGDFNQMRNFLNEEQKQKQYKEELLNRRVEENKQRLEDGLELLPLELENKFKELKAPSRINSLLYSNQVKIYSEQISQYSNDSMKKLFLVQLLNGGLNNTETVEKKVEEN
eukprot:TRINITY_DN887_c1_g3_i1.p1 TRINITY_DN887_c1_g3~~TRINITY_DN887_c1_g3_i1.p1  ORF type:complete len:314 (-),score=101.97 TRINITY_DN887_c1_g3_i1:48-989(-)